MKSFLNSILLSGSLLAVLPVSGVDLKQSKFTQVVNDVKVVAMSDKSQKAAAVNDIFKMPDIVHTGPNSRAELVADDRTITRVGANTLFSFDPASRTIDLQKGSLLFHSPKGKGGGTVRSGSAIASVLGTTIMVGTTPDGGFKVLVLEGTAKVKLANGRTVFLTAGQEVFVLPGSKDFSPVINFRLDTLIGESRLVSGFDNPLPSMDKIKLAIDDQEHLLHLGKGEDTGLTVGDSATISGVDLVDENDLPQNTTLPRDHDGHIILGPEISPAALNDDAIIDSSTLDTKRIFDSPTAVNAPGITGTYTGFFARNISFVEGSSTVDLTPYHSLPNFTFLASGNINFENGVHFTGNTISYGDLSIVAAGTITTPVDCSFSYSGSGFFFHALGSLSFDTVSFYNYQYNGEMGISSGNFLTMKDCSVSGGTMTLSGVTGVSLNNTYINANSGGSKGLVSTQNFFSATISSSHGSVTMNDGSIYADVLNVKAANTINFNSTYLSSLSSVSMAAKTIILENINFASFSTVNLSSLNGVLAPNPNTGASPIAGDVNFINNVTYGGDAAQNHVNPSSGTGIFIKPLH